LSGLAPVAEVDGCGTVLPRLAEIPVRLSTVGLVRTSRDLHGRQRRHAGDRVEVLDLKHDACERVHFAEVTRRHDGRRCVNSRILVETVIECRSGQQRRSAIRQHEHEPFMLRIVRKGKNACGAIRVPRHPAVRHALRKLAGFERQETRHVGRRTVGTRDPPRSEESPVVQSGLSAVLSCPFFPLMLLPWPASLVECLHEGVLGVAVEQEGNLRCDLIADIEQLPTS